MSPLDERTAVKEVMRYFVQRPHCVDSLEGIARWRILEQRIHESVAETAAAIEWLVEQRYLEAIDVHSGPPLYRLREEQLAAAQALIANEGGEKER